MRKLEWATCDPDTLSEKNPVQLYNLVGGEWTLSRENVIIIDPLNGENFIKMPNTHEDELEPFIRSLQQCPKSGLHNIYKNPERYNLYGRICFQLAKGLHDPQIADFFTKCIQRVCPKSYVQAMGEVTVVRTFLENFSGDNVRFLAQGFMVPGDHMGQISTGLRWPYGPVVVVSPFNFPLEIPVLQIIAALMMGNKVTLKCASTTTLVMEQWVRYMHHCGCPKTDLDLLHCGGRVMGTFVAKVEPRMLQFTGSCEVAEELSRITHGKIKIEDAGFDWKILGGDVQQVEYVAWQCDQDAYASTGQKCSAQSMLFAHTNWLKDDINFINQLKKLAERRKLEDLTIAPVLSHTTEEIFQHMKKCLELPGAKLLFGGVPLENHKIPTKYGAIHPTCVFVPLEEILRSKQNFDLCTKEIFGPFYILTEWKDDQLSLVLKACEMMNQHLTAAIVSNDIQFVQKCLGNTVNGTTYAGLRARTTGAPQNHWFGPCGDPRGAGIGSPYAILHVWTCHREVIQDFGPIPVAWATPKPS